VLRGVTGEGFVESYCHDQNPVVDKGSLPIPCPQTFLWNCFYFIFWLVKDCRRETRMSHRLQIFCASEAWGSGVTAAGGRDWNIVDTKFLRCPCQGCQGCHLIKFKSVTHHGHGLRLHLQPSLVGGRGFLCRTRFDTITGQADKLNAVWPSSNVARTIMSFWTKW
jgi:hypothetical protein